jgi:hypothetical protein
MRVDALDKPGGDLQQIRSYIRAGMRIDEPGVAPFAGEVITDLGADFGGYDVVHLTNLDRPVDTFAFMRGNVGDTG